MGQSESQLNLVGRDIGVATSEQWLLNGLEGTWTGLEGAPGDTERVHGGGYGGGSGSMAVVDKH